MTPQPFTLDNLQRWMQSVITNLHGVTAGASSAEARSLIDIPSDALELVINPSRQQSSEERLSIYHRAYFARLLECLRDIFPMTARLLGEEAFDDLAVEYLQRNPSRSYTLGRLGDRFADFLAAIRPEDDSAVFADFVVDLVRLEWEINEVFDGPGMEDAKPFDPRAIQSASPDQWADVCLTPAPCLRLLSFRFPINDCYSRLRDEQEPALPELEETYLALSRRSFIVQRFPLGRAEFLALSTLVRGEPIGVALASALAGLDAADSPVELSPAIVHDWFQAWAQASFFAAARLP
ncbi:MAG: putative DNA-binding domain-containing protein [Pirellulales bacterium]